MRLNWSTVPTPPPDHLAASLPFVLQLSLLIPFSSPPADPVQSPTGSSSLRPLFLLSLFGLLPTFCCPSSHQSTMSLWSTDYWSALPIIYPSSRHRGLRSLFPGGDSFAAAASGTLRDCPFRYSHHSRHQFTMSLWSTYYWSARPIIDPSPLHRRLRSLLFAGFSPVAPNISTSSLGGLCSMMILGAARSSSV